MSRRRIVVVHNRYRQRGGEDSVAEAEVALLREHGHEVALYTRDSRELEGLGKLDASAQALWSRRVRLNPYALFLIAIVINVGMWMERFMIIVVSLERDFLPSSWGVFKPTFWDWATLAGSLGTFALLFLLFVRFLPMISMYEVRELLPYSKPGGGSAK